MLRRLSLIWLAAVLACSAACAEPDNFPLDAPNTTREDAAVDEEPPLAPWTPPEDAGQLEPPVAVMPAPGWSLRDALPYPRVGHAAVFDSDRDRMLVFGGSANDVWALELAGARANTWSQLHVNGEFPPVHRYGEYGTIPSYEDAAVYVPERHSMVVVLNPTPTVSDATDRTEVWELSLEAEPRWSQLTVLGAPDGAEIQSAAAVYDPGGRRILMAGGDIESSGLWALNLEAGREPSWTRLGDAPAERAAFLNGHSLLLDAAHNRVLLVGGSPRQGEVFAFDLDESTWSTIDEGTPGTSGYGFAMAVDPRRDTLVVVGGDQASDAVSTFSLADETWQNETAPRTFNGASIIVDTTRDRLILFGGEDDDGSLRSETWAFALASHEWEQLGEAPIAATPRMIERTFAYDPERDAVIAFGGYTDTKTLAYQLGGSAGVPTSWSSLPVAATTPTVSFSAAIYDPSRAAVVTFGGYDYRESSQLSMLSSASENEWQALQADGASPPERSGHTMVYDAQHTRAIVFGGQRDTSYPPSEDFNDVWALALDGTPTWTQLAPSGDAPSAGAGALAIYDPIGKRMVVLQSGVMQALALDTEPSWSWLTTTGSSPGIVLSGAALYDPERHSMVVLKHEDTGTLVFALDLATQVWQRYCSETITPAPHLHHPRISNAVLVPDGIFMAFDNAVYRFDLTAPFCAQ
jgi:hypothetical protein